MNAKEMFEKLGFEERDYDLRVDYVKKYDSFEETITFRYIDQEIYSSISCVIEDDPRLSYFNDSKPIYINELKAIITKIKELGWLE